jgi:hypothetical protein
MKNEEMENSGFEALWEKQAIDSMKGTLEFIDAAKKITTKYKFNKLYSDIIHKLLKSNQMLWGEVEGASEEHRKVVQVIDNVEKYIQEYVNNINELRTLSNPDALHIERLKALEDGFEYFTQNYDPETKELTKYRDINQNYSDIDLIEFFVNHVDGISRLIDAQIEEEGATTLSKEELLVEYVARLFAFHLQGCIIEIGDNDNKIKIKMKLKENE